MEIPTEIKVLRLQVTELRFEARNLSSLVALSVRGALSAVISRL